VTNPDAEERAFDLLQWNPYSLPTEYDDELALVGYYSKTQAERSNAALDAWEEQHPFKSSDELTAFRELERLGVYTDADFYSPSKAKDGHYTKRLKQLRDNPREPQRSPRASQQARSIRKHRPL
jgi:hypothetical protein